MTQEEVKKIILSGCKFKYYSYDHKKAEDEFLKNMQLVKLQRLSVSIVKPEEFDRVCMLGGL